MHNVELTFYFVDLEMLKRHILNDDVKYKIEKVRLACM